MLLSPGPARTLVRAGQVLLALGALVYTGSLLLPVRPDVYDPLLDGWLNNSLWALAALLCLARAVLVRAERAAWAVFGMALLLYLAGSLVYYLQLHFLDPVPYPSSADALWIVFYVLTYLAVALLLRARVGRLPTGTWLDGLVGGLGAGALGAVVLEPVMHGSDGALSAVLTNLAYPIVDLLLVVLLVAGAAVLGWRPGPSWWLLTAGLACLVVADSG
jgi:hypothetical protein